MECEHLDKNESVLVANVSNYIAKAFPFLFLILCFTMPFAKAIAGPVYVTCIVLFVIQMFFRKEYQTEVSKYYLAMLLYLLVIALSLTYTSDFLEGLGILKQQCIVILGVILIERIPSIEAAQRCLYAYTAGGTVLALIAACQGLFLKITRPPTIWQWVHGGNLLLISSVVLIALLISEKNLMIRIANMFMLAIHGVALYLNGTRGAWVALAAVILIVPFVYRSICVRKRLIYLASVSVIVLVACNGNFFHDKILEARNDIIAYSSSNSVTSLGARFEMWKASSLMFRENPMLGVGAGGWENELKKMVGQHKAPTFIQQFNQTHSNYLDALSTRGLVGLASLLILIACPLYYAIKSSAFENALFRNVIIFVSVAFLISGLTETLVRIRFVFMSYAAVTGIGLAALIRLSVKKVKS